MFDFLITAYLDIQQGKGLLEYFVMIQKYSGAVSNCGMCMHQYAIWYMKSGGQIFYLSSVTIKQSQCCGVTFPLYSPWCLYFCCKYDLTYGLINYYALPRVVSCVVLISLLFLVQYLWIWIHSFIFIRSYLQWKSLLENRNSHSTLKSHSHIR